MRTRGFLVAALLIIMVFFIVAIGILTKQPNRRLAAFQTHYQVQAREIALAGIDDARLRMLGNIQHTTNNVTYDRVLSSPDGVEVGVSHVRLDYSWRDPPYQVLLIESEGVLGDPVDPRAIYRVQATIDLKPEARTGGGDNPRLFQVIRWREAVP